MTIKQEAYQLIDALPEDSVKIIVELMYKMDLKERRDRQSFDFTSFVTPTERADFADEQIRELRQNDRV